MRYGRVATPEVSAMGSGMSGRILAFAAAVAVGFGTTGAKAEPAKWDQKRVTSIAQQLAAAVGELRENIRKQPPIPTRRSARSATKRSTTCAR